MGEVYKARDTKLDRDVAIKVLPAALARDPERLARFEREAKVLASLYLTMTVFSASIVTDLVTGAPVVGTTLTS